ncbi:hypothetical protein POSPLADRAFT_1170100 [Postia placenta MAD-698-R-SB12]|uniref:NAD(P)-binding protein n=1 Tax=Postia placenta MAD-698-R-SB12 TaxID=670580 RepID=A0A1X6N203_9APHY|nr:hypothetical protein POSPLADRAFT_1170100 [Postia placenta MAD-698-R-SB12]OSX62496.1 hypothetical protein POSPLADRAFT_1170100 [Postia placenta MAD-698-R-SB12]
MGSFLTEAKYFWQYLVQLLLPGKPQFSTKQIPDLTGQVMLVTGVYLAARSRERAEAAIQDLQKQTGKTAIFLELDMSSLASVRKAAKEFMSKETALHVLFNNAGVMWCSIELLSADGYDLQFATNVIGHFYFTKLLIPALLVGRDSSPDRHARIVTTSSSTAYLYTINWESFKDGPARRKMSTRQLYSQSKFANVVVARETAKRYADQGIISLSLDPGSIDTEIQRTVPGIQRWLARVLVFYPASFGALTQLWAGTMPEAINHNGKFLIPWARVGRCREEAYDDRIGERLWDWLEEQVKAFQPEA